MRNALPVRPLFESLESRRLLSVAPAVVAHDAAAHDPTAPIECVSDEQIAADRAKVQASMAKLRAEQVECTRLLTADRAALQAARAALEAQLAPLREKLAEDHAECVATLQADRRAIEEVRREGHATILEDLAALRAAGSDHALRRAAMEKLNADRHVLRQKLAPLMEKLHEDMAECAALLAADRKAIADVLHNDTAVKQAHDKLLADTLACREKLAAARHQLQADVLKLRTDLAHRCPDGEPDHGGHTRSA